MRDYAWLHEYCLTRFGSREALEARLPVPASAETLTALPDDRYLSLMALRIFRAGLKHSLVDAKWPAFEEAFFRFDPEKVVLMSGEHIERLMQDKRLIRHLGKLRSVPHNAQLLLDIRREYGGAGSLIAHWPVTEIVALWRLLTRRGSQLGGLSAPRYLRMLGKDTFVPTNDVVAALAAQKVVDRVPSSRRDLAAVQDVFNLWHEQSGRPMCQLSVMLAHTVNH